MVIPAIAVCPICGKKTYLRIEDGGYLYEYPIRVYCLNCRTLIRGIYVMDRASGPLGLHLFNAEKKDCRPSQGSFREIDADYLAEISGELPTKKVCTFNGKIPQSTPYIDASKEIDIIPRKEQLKRYYSNMREWEKWKSIAFQLLNEDAIEFIPTALRNRMGSYPYECSDYLRSLHCLQEVVREYSDCLFQVPGQREGIKSLLSILSAIDRVALRGLVARIGGIEGIKNAYRKVINLYVEFMAVYPNLLPAETYMRYKNRNDSSLGIATCSFSDIKSLYQDGYETLMSLMTIIVALDNILVRGNYRYFNVIYSRFYQEYRNRKRYEGMSDDFERYEGLDNGKRADFILHSEPIQKCLCIRPSRYLRNAITHNTYQYDGLTQIITVFDQRNPTKVNETKSLLEMALDCLDIAKATVLTAEILLFLLREEDSACHGVLHPSFYAELGRNDKCPCGSNRKYKNCCFEDVQDMLNFRKGS